VKLKKYIAELKRRNLFKFAITYLIVAWVLTQVFSIVLPTYGAPVYFMKVLILVLVVGFPIALVFAWIYRAPLKPAKEIINAEVPHSVSSKQEPYPILYHNKLVVLPFQNISSDDR
jgi:adenylate cyclase